MTKLIQGCIPAHTECPFQLECIGKQACHHHGNAHPVPFSCAFARGWEMVYNIPPQLKAFEPRVLHT